MGMTPDDEQRIAAFKTWLGEVNLLCLKRFGIALNDLPDMCTRDAFDGGVHPEEFFEEDVMGLMREEFGDLVDEA